MPSTPAPSKGNGVQPFDSALSMAKGIRDGTVTSRQLVEMHIERIERLDGGLNAVIARNFEAARRAAGEADEKRRQWKAGALVDELAVFHGVPMTVKESNPTPGFKTTYGDPSVTLPSWVESDATKVLLRDAGAILLGKTNQPMNTCDWEVNNPVYGRTGNPYDPNRSPGGSSGGAAAALAAGLTPLELGSDVGGSIRVPAAMCGVVGHCATRNVVPRISLLLGCGCVDRLLATFLEPMMWMGREGPMARTVEDVTALLEVLGGEMADALQRPKNGSRLADYRIAVWRSHDICPAGREVSSAMNQAVAALKAAGATVEELEPPVDPAETYKTYLRYLSPFTKMHMPKEQKQNVTKGRPEDSYPSDIRSPFSEMDMASVNGIPNDTRAAYEEAAVTWNEHLKNYDVILAPVFPCEAWPNASEPRAMLSDAKVLSRKLLVDGEERYYGDGLFWAHLSVLFGLPATGFPVSFSKGGLPVGLQAIGAKGNDFIVLDVVQKLMQALGRNEFRPPPGFE